MHVPLGPLVSGRFLRRDNRFRVEVELPGGREPAHLPNSGRLGELLVPGRKVWLAPADLARSPHRRTAYDLALVEFAGQLVSVDARVPSALVAAALLADELPGFRRRIDVHREVTRGESRLDFRVDFAPPRPACWVEVKSVTLVVPPAHTALFPDAPTSRGQRHLEELTRVVQEGADAAVLFIVQRQDARCFAPHDEADPTFGRLLRRAAQAGVQVHAWRCQVNLMRIKLIDTIPVIL